MVVSQRRVEVRRVCPVTYASIGHWPVAILCVIGGQLHHKNQRHAVNTYEDASVDDLLGDVGNFIAEDNFFCLSAVAKEDGRSFEAADPGAGFGLADARFALSQTWSFVSRLMHTPRGTSVTSYF